MAFTYSVNGQSSTVPVNINSPDTTSLQSSKDSLKDQITGLQSVGLPTVIPDPWAQIKDQLLTQHQIAKKMMIMQNQNSIPPMSEEDAQFFVYGKLYYKNGKLYDNDKLDPACISKPGDEDYSPPMDETHPMFEKISAMIKDLEDQLKQMGIKLGEFTLAIPATIATIVISLVALVSSAIIMPPGSGIPTALTAVKTMMSAIKELQAKTAQILPLLAIIDTIALLLPKEAQSIVAIIAAIIAAFLVIVGGITAILGLIGGVSSSLSKSQTKLASAVLTVAPKADPSSVTQGQSSNLSANASGGDWNYTFQWTDANGSIVAQTAAGDDDGTRTVTPVIPNITPTNLAPTTTYTCKVTDGTGAIKQSTITITRI